MEREFIHKIFDDPEADFEHNALRMFRFQYENNTVYRQYAHAIGVKAGQVNSVIEIPFLPIRFFKSHSIQTTCFSPDLIFESSGTSQTINSRHLVKDASIYRKSFVKTFESFYGNPHDYCVIGLLPSYLERKNSSLIMMVDELIELSHHPGSGFYLYDHETLSGLLKNLESKEQKTILIGVTYALLDFAEQFPMNLRHTIIMETGGMKGRRQELTRQEVHERLKSLLGLKTVHAEYGMTELLSQAYSSANGVFKSPHWMRVFTREEDDPFLVRAYDTSAASAGILNIVDLANIYSCSFIATDDVGRVFHDGSFEVLGRMDNSDIRGCSLLAL